MIDKRDHETDNARMCPLTRKPCMEHMCEWWLQTNPPWFSSCVVWHADRELTQIVFELRGDGRH